MKNTILQKSSKSDGAVTEQRAASGNGTTSQQWRADYMGSGLFRLTASHAGKVLGVRQASTSEKAVLDQETDILGNHQMWRLRAML
jgi:hypothetical protein